MRRLILKPFLLSISLVMAIIISGLPVNAAGPIGSETTSVASSSDTYNGVTVTAQPTPNNYKIQFLGSDSNIIIGNGTNSFTPSFTINRWGETSFTLSLASPMMGDLGNGTLSTDQSIAQNNTVSFSNSDFSIKYNPVDNTTGMNELGGLDFSFMMKAMPVSNSLLFNYTQNSVSAYFQPPLTQEYTVGTQPEGNVISKVTDTDVYDGSDQVIVHRPDYAVNSIAFYADGKQGDYTALGGKNYKTGKIGQLYRMKAVDSKGNWTWANWGLSGSTINLTVDQNWLNNATYPIMIEPVGDTFGWTSIGLSDDGIALHAWFSDSGDIWSEIRAGYNAAPVAAGNLSSISAYLGSYSGGESCNVKVLLNKNSDGSQVAIKENTGCSASYGWKTFTCNNEPIQAITYRIDIVGDAGSLTAPPTSMYAIKLDSTYPVSNAEYYYSYSSPPNSFYSGPQNPWTTYATSYGRFSIYATYAPKNLCLAITSDFSFNDAQAFANVLTQYGGWNQSALSNNPDRTWWQEEGYPAYGTDNNKADYCQLSFLGAHGFDGNNHELSVTQIAFPSGGWIDNPSTVKMGYLSPDNYGFNIWNYISSCRLLKDPVPDGNGGYTGGYLSWEGLLQGTHMLLGYKSDAVGDGSEMQEMANRLVGENYFTKQNIQNAYFSTYVKDDNTHRNNICRIIAQNSDVANNDWIDSYNPYITVNNSYTIITCYIP